MAALVDVLLLVVSLTERAAMDDGTLAAEDVSTLGFGGGGGGGTSSGGRFGGGGGGGALTAVVDADVTELTDVILFS